MLWYPDMINFLMFYSSELGSKDLSDYKNSKACSYYKSRWLQPSQYHNLSGSKYCIIRGECRKSQSIKDPFHKLWIILEKTAKIRTCHYTYMAGMGETCNHVAAVMYRVEAAVRISLPSPACTSNPNDWLPNWKTIEPKKTRYLDFSREDFFARQRGKKETSSSFTKKEVWSTEKLWFKTIAYKGFCWSYQQNFPSKYITYCGTQAKGGFFQRTYFNKNCST